MKSTIWAVVALAFVSLAGNIFQYLTIKDTEETHTTEIEMKDEEVRRGEGRVREIEVAKDFWESFADSLLNNPVVKTNYVDRWRVKTDTVEVYIEIPPDAMKFFEDTLEYTGDNALKFNTLVTAEGDTITIHVAQRVFLKGYITKDKKFYLSDENEYWLQRLNIIKRHIQVIHPLEIPKYQTYFGLTAHGDFDAGKVKLLIGGNLVIDNKFNFSIFGNDSSLQLGVSYNVLSKIGF